MSATVLRGNALNLQPLPDGFVDLIVTSPPYFGLRSYQDGGEHYEGQIGAEATPAEFVDALIAATREMVRVLKPSGSIWVNLGDKYAGSTGGGVPSSSSTLRGNGHVGGGPKQQAGGGRPDARKIGGAPTKSLIGIPWRYAIRCIDELGLILRAEVIWSKPNGLPESVTDRVRRSHEVWFHFTKEPRYFAAVDEIREPYTDVAKAKGHLHSPTRGYESDVVGIIPQNPLGKLPGSVRSVPTQPLRIPPEVGVQHFAAFPMEWPRWIIAGWSPSAICTVCGEGRRPVVAKPGLKGGDNNPHSRDGSRTRSELDGGQKAWDERMKHPDYISGYACACPDISAPTVPAVVLDPFGGTGTTALMADVMGRAGLSVDMSADYCRAAEWRISDPKERAKAEKKVREAGAKSSEPPLSAQSEDEEDA